MRPVPDRALGGWINQQPREDIWTTAVTIFEIRFGIESLPVGRRKEQLEISFARTIIDDLRERVVDFNREAATIAGALAAHRRSVGRPVDVRDIEIAGIVACQRATLATRNTRHFENLGIEVVNPWMGK